MARMTACIFEGEGEFSIEERKVPDVSASGDVLIEVRAAGICGTDRHILDLPPGHPAKPGIVLGHEYVGEVVDAAEGASLQKGDLVAIDPNLTCGRCFYCLRGMPNMCLSMTTLGIFMDGGFAGYSLVPERACYPLPQGLAPDVAVFCEPLSCVVNGMAKLMPMTGETALVAGAGCMGNYFIQLLSSSGVKVLVSEIEERRGELALKGGACGVVNPKRESLVDFIRSFAPHGVDMAVEATGLCLDDVIPLVRRGGRILLLGMVERSTSMVRQYEIVRNELRIMGTYISNHSFPATLDILSRGSVNTGLLTSHRLPLDSFGEGIELMKRGEALKVILKP